MANVFICQVFAGEYMPQMPAPGACYLGAHAISI
jgi:hypothetical protein